MGYAPRQTAFGRIEAVTSPAAGGLHFLRAAGPNFLDNVLAIRNETYSLGDPKTVSIAGNTLTSNGHGMDERFFVWVESTGALPGGLSAQTDYHVVNWTANTFQLSLTKNGAAITLTNAGTGTVSVRTINRGHSAIIWSGHDENPLYGPAAIGLNKNGFDLFERGTFFIATNTTNADPNTPANDIMINQHQGPASQIHARVYFSGINHTTHFPGWDTSNLNSMPDNGLWIAEDGRIGCGQLPPDAAFAKVANTFIGGGLSAGLTIQDRTHSDDEAWVVFANEHYLFFRHYLGGMGDGWNMYSFSGDNRLEPAYDNAWKLGTHDNAIRIVNSYSLALKPTNATFEELTGSVTEGQIWYDATAHALKYQDNTGVKTISAT